MLYELFLTNLIAEGVKETVIPLAQSSIDATRHLWRSGLRPNLVHLDAAKDYATVLAELEAYWDVLQPGGALIGSRFAWKHIQAAIEAFAEPHSLDCVIRAPSPNEALSPIGSLPTPKFAFTSSVFSSRSLLAGKISADLPLIAGSPALHWSGKSEAFPLPWSNLKLLARRNAVATSREFHPAQQGKSWP
jgi:hypothetical protein